MMVSDDQMKGAVRKVHTSESTTKDQDIDIFRDGTNERAEFEYYNCTL